MSKSTVQERKDYLKKKVNPIVEKMMADIMMEMPDDITKFMASWIKTRGPKIEEQLKKKKGIHSRPEGIESSSDEDEDEEEIDIAALQRSRKSKAGRTSVSAEVYGRWNQKKAYVPKVVPKSIPIKKRLREKLQKSFMFQALEEKQREIVINAMEEKRFRKGDSVIKQGDDGDVLYVVDSGTLDCFKIFSGDTKPTPLLVYKPGTSFGELALLYNCPRAASIVALEDSVLYSVDRECFNNIVKDAAIKKRNRYMEFLGKVPLLETLDDYEKGKICDCLQSQKYIPGKYIIREGEGGSTFFFVEEGKAYATKKNSGGTEEKVYSYGENDYFGELALLQDAPRAASIVAETNLSVAWIDRDAFKRLLGPLVNLLKRNSSRYEEKMQELGINL